MMPAIPAALKKLAASGAKLAPFPQDVLEACFNAAKETYAEMNATNAPFKKIHDAMMAFRADAYLWVAVFGIPVRPVHDGPAAQEAALGKSHPR